MCIRFFRPSFDGQNHTHSVPNVGARAIGKNNDVVVWCTRSPPSQLFLEPLHVSKLATTVEGMGEPIYQVALTYSIFGRETERRFWREEKLEEITPSRMIGRRNSTPLSHEPHCKRICSSSMVVGGDGAVATAAMGTSLRVKKLSEHAVLPSRGSEGAAGYDLSAAYECVVPARGKALVKTDLSIAIPEGTYARIAPRSGLAWKHSIDVGAGVVDADYRGNVGVILFNLSDQEFQIKAGDRVAQLILERIATPEVVEVEDLDDTTRGAGGFGSTGVNQKDQ